MRGRGLAGSVLGLKPGTQTLTWALKRPQNNLLKKAHLDLGNLHTESPQNWSTLNPEPSGCRATLITTAEVIELVFLYIYNGTIL